MKYAANNDDIHTFLVINIPSTVLQLWPRALMFLKIKSLLNTVINCLVCVDLKSKVNANLYNLSKDLLQKLPEEKLF